MEKDEIFKFEDFLSGDKMEDLKKMKSELLKEGLFNESEESEYEINQDFNPYNIGGEDNFLSKTELDIDIELEDETYEESISNEKSYILYKDKSEEFVCDIAVEGVNQNDTEVRLIIESKDWNLMFKGEIKNGKCIIPLKKLSILNEGQTGNIKLEVNADGNLFTPWENEFVVKVSKKVTVSLNENRSDLKQMVKSKPGVKVNVK